MPHAIAASDIHRMAIYKSIRDHQPLYTIDKTPAPDDLGVAGNITDNDGGNDAPGISKRLPQSEGVDAAASAAQWEAAFAAEKTAQMTATLDTSAISHAPPHLSTIPTLEEGALTTKSQASNNPVCQPRKQTPAFVQKFIHVYCCLANSM
jgi:hypothetical protein